MVFNIISRRLDRRSAYSLLNGCGTYSYSYSGTDLSRGRRFDLVSVPLHHANFKYPLLIQPAAYEVCRATEHASSGSDRIIQAFYEANMDATVFRSPHLAILELAFFHECLLYIQKV